MTCPRCEEIEREMEQINEYSMDPIVYAQVPFTGTILVRLHDTGGGRRDPIKEIVSEAVQTNLMFFWTKGVDERIIEIEVDEFVVPDDAQVEILSTEEP